MGYYPYATYLLPHCPNFRPASQPSSLNPSAYYYDNCDFHPAGIWSVILLKSVTDIQLSIFIFSLACLKPEYSINQSCVVHKGLSWSIFAKKVSVCDLFLIYAKISYCLPSWLYTSAKYEICKSCIHYTMRFCVCLWTWLVFFQGFTPESGVLVLAFKQMNNLCLPHENIQTKK